MLTRMTLARLPPTREVKNVLYETRECSPRASCLEILLSIAPEEGCFIESDKRADREEENEEKTVLPIICVLKRRVANKFRLLILP